MKKQILVAVTVAAAVTGACAAEFNKLALTASGLAGGNQASFAPIPDMERLDISLTKQPDPAKAGPSAEYGRRIRLQKDIFLKRSDSMYLQFREKAKGKYSDICGIEAYMLVVDTSVPAAVMMQGTALNITRVSDRETYSDTEGDGAEYQISGITVQLSEDNISNMVASCRAKKGTRRIPSLSEVESMFTDYFIVSR